MNRVPALIVAVAMTVGAAASAEAGGCGSTGCFDVKVDELCLYGAALGFLIQTSGDEALLNCTAMGGAFISVPESTRHRNELYATLLAAKVSERNVSIRINEGTDPCAIAYMRLN